MSRFLNFLLRSITMKALYKQLISIASENENLYRNPVDNESIQILVNEYDLNIQEANFFIVILKKLMERNFSVDLDSIADDLEVEPDEYVSLLGVAQSLKEKRMLSFESEQSIFKQFNPSINLDQNIFMKLILGRDMLDQCNLENPFSIIQYADELMNSRKEGRISTSRLFSELNRLIDNISPSLTGLLRIKMYSDEEKAIIFRVISVQLNGNDMFDNRASNIGSAIYEDYSMSKQLYAKILNRDLEIIKSKIVIIEDNSVFLDDPAVRLSPKYRSEFLDIEPPKNKKQQRIHTEFSKFLKYSDIKTHKLFYEPSVEKEVNLLTKAFERKTFKQLCKQLKSSNYTPGVVTLFYGAPGTGKTASAYAIAKAAKRDILQVDISRIRDKYVGESEKRIKAIFEEYSDAKETLRTAPILLFNEADALIGRRISIDGSVDQMNNSMQNILLEQLENFEGIFIATTNLNSNMDKAFARRFLYKVEFPVPSQKTRNLIWREQLKGLDNHDYELLSSYKISGGEIALIAKKSLLYNILHNKTLLIQEIQHIIKREIEYRQDSTNTMGFLAKNS